MNNSTKIDPELSIAMQFSDAQLERSVEAGVGYQVKDKTWRLIVKYGGDIHLLAEKYGAVAEILSDTYAIVTIGENHISAFSKEIEIEYIEKPKRLQYQLNLGIWETCVAPVNNYAAYNLKGNGVLIGVIDSGLDYAHPDFLDANGNSRVLRLWDQSVDGKHPEGFSHGAEYTNQELDEMIRTCVPGQPLPSGDYSGHGTMVTGVAAGNGAASSGTYCGAAPQAALAIVKLGTTDYEGYPIKTIDVMFGIKYLVTLARNLNMPLAINLSYGSGYGSRDGLGLFETYINEMALQWKSVIVSGSGNDAAKRAHTDGNIKTDASISFSVSEYTSNVSLELWKSYADEFDIEVIYPSGISTGYVPHLHQVLQYGYRNESIFILFSPPTPFNTNDSIHIEIITSIGYLEEGIWTIVLHPKNVLQGNYEIWLHSNGSEGSQFFNPIMADTLTLPGTVQNVITVGAYDYHTGNIAGFSGHGSVNKRIIKPDLAAPGVNITTTTMNGGYGNASGTSIAAPYVTGACALMMQWGIVNNNDPYLYGSKVKAYLYSGCVRDKDMPYPNNIWGYGKLCLQEVMNHLMQENPPKQITYMENDSPPTGSTTPPTSDPKELEQLIRSNNYVDLIAEKTAPLLEHAKYDNDVIIGYEIEKNEVIIHVEKAIVNKVIEDLAVLYSLSYPLLYGLLDVDSLNASSILPVQYHPGLALEGEGVLVGILDTGIDYTHPAFIDDMGHTRIQAIWDQSVLTGNPPSPFLFGTEYDEAQINQALQSDDPLSVVPSTDDNGHGTFLAGICCGGEAGKYLGVAPKSELVCVKLAPAKKYARTNSMLFNDDVVAFQATDVLMGIRYLIEKARTLQKPIAILMGIGTAQGPHTGLSFERLTNYRRGVAIVAACGNEGNTMNHAMGKLNFTGDTHGLELNVAENEEGIEINLWTYLPDKISVGLISPSGEVIERVPVRNTMQAYLKLVFYETTIWIDYFQSAGVTGDQLTVIRLKNPEPGIWKITIFGDYIAEGHYHAWAPLRNWTHPDTSFLNSDSEYTVTEFGNSFEVISVGAYNHTNQHLYVGSSRGPTRLEHVRPDIIAPGVNIAGPLPNDAHGYQSGTSVAAAHVAGAAALLLEWGIVNGNQKNLDTQSIRTLLISGARRRSGIVYPNNQYGYGELDLMNTFTEMNTNAPLESFGLYLDIE